MIHIKKEDNTDSESKEDIVVDILSDQGYTKEYIRNYIISHISDTDDYPGIRAAYDGDYASDSSVKDIESFVDGFMIDYLYDKLIEVGKDYKYDFTELVDDIIEENKDIIKDFDSEYQYLVDKEIQDWKDEMAYMNREYYRSR